MRHDLDLVQQASPEGRITRRRLMRAKAVRQRFDRPIYILAIVVAIAAIAAVPGRALFFVVTGS